MFTKKEKQKANSNEPNKRAPFFQAKLKVGKPGDKYEVEADKMADKVVNNEGTSNNTVQKKEGEEEVQQKPLASEISPLIQKMETSEEEAVQKMEEEESVQKMEEEEPVQKMEEEEVQQKEEEEPIQKMEEEESVQKMEEEEVQQKEEEEVQAKSTDNKKKSPSIEGKLRNGSGGTKMDNQTKNQMESGFGADFSQVNIHNDNEAAQMSQDIGAQAFTHGNDVYFNKGKYNPNSKEGKHLLAHELTHTVQQKGVVQKKIQKKQARRKTYPWNGEITTRYNAAMRSTPKKDKENPHKNTVADLAKGHKVKVLSKTNGWLKVQTKVGNVVKTGYVSKELVGLTYQANTAVSQTITNASNPAWNGTYGWDSKFGLIFSYNKKELTVRIKLHANTTKVIKSNWKSAVEGKWSYKKKLQVIENVLKPDNKDTYKIKIEIEWVDKAVDAHYSITANQPNANDGGRAGVGGTTSMTGWGVGDATDVPHEFGHMLGNKDEYHTIDGTNYGVGRQVGKGIMNNPAEAPFLKHFNTIKSKAALALNIPVAQCTIIN